MPAPVCPTPICPAWRAFPFRPVLNRRVRNRCESDRTLSRTEEVSPERRVSRACRRFAGHKGITMAEGCETNAVVRTFDREVNRLKSAAASVGRENRGPAWIGDMPTSEALSRDPVDSASGGAELLAPATTISAARSGFEATGAGPMLRFLGGSDPGPDRFWVCGAASGTGATLWTLLTQCDQPMSSFVPDHGLRIGGKDRKPGR